MSKSIINLVGKSAVNLLKCSALLLGSTLLTEALASASRKTAGDLVHSVRSIHRKDSNPAA